MAKDQTPTPGTHFGGPLHIEPADPAGEAFTDLPDGITLAGDYAADVDEIEAILNALLERIK